MTNQTNRTTFDPTGRIQTWKLVTGFANDPSAIVPNDSVRFIERHFGQLGTEVTDGTVDRLDREFNKLTGSANRRAIVVQRCALKLDALHFAIAENLDRARKEVQMKSSAGTLWFLGSPTFDYPGHDLVLIRDPLGVLVEPAIREIFFVENDVDVVDLPKFAKFDWGEFDLRWTTATEDVNVGYRRSLEVVIDIGRDVGAEHVVGLLGQNSSNIQCDISVA